MSLFKNRPRKIRMAYRVENLNSEKNISSTIKVDDERREYVVCLCIANTMTKTVFPSYQDALDQMCKYRKLYKEKKNK